MGELEPAQNVIPVVLQGNLDGLAAAGETVANFDFRWRDGWLFALGGEYDWSPDLTLRTGVAYEVSPVDGATTRLVQDPDKQSRVGQRRLLVQDERRFAARLLLQPRVLRK